MGEARETRLPERHVERLAAPLVRFLHIEAAGGVVLVVCTAVALVLANSGAGPSVEHFWHQTLALEFGGSRLEHSLAHWINDGLMVIFFLVIGLEIKRELVIGELRDPRSVVLPVAAAVGGAVIPVGLFLLVVGDAPEARGWAIPMATDIAFVVGCLALLGPRVPRGLKVFMLSLAIVDDLLGVLVIAAVFSEHFAWTWLAGAGGGLALMVTMNRLGVRSIAAYVVVGVGVWFCTLLSGIHPTVAGVAIGLLTPTRRWLDRDLLLQVMRDAERALADGAPGDEAAERRVLSELAFASTESISPLARVEDALHVWVAFLIMPIFALANAGVEMTAGGLLEPLPIAVAVGLCVGKPVGIMLLSLLVVGAGLARLPDGVRWAQLGGASCLGGIGFTMALFIASLALDGAALAAAKQGVLLGSVVSAALGMVVLWFTLRSAPDDP